MAIVEQRELKQALDAVIPFTLPRDQERRNVRVWGSGGVVQLSAGMGGHWATALVASDGPNDLDILIDAKELRAAIGAHKGQLDISGEGETLTIGRIGEARRGSIRGIPTTDWGEPTFDGEIVGTLAIEDLRDAIARVTVAASKDQYRAVLQYVQLSVTGARDRITLVGCDGYRLAKDEQPLSWAGGNDAEVRLLVPAKELGIVGRALGKLPAQDRVRVWHKDGAITSFVTDRCSFSLAATEALFPDWKTVVPEGKLTTVVVDQGELLDAIDVAKAFTPDTELLKLYLERDALVLVTPTHRDRVAAKIDGNAKRLAINVNYFRDAVKGHGGTIQIGFNDGTAVTFTSARYPDYLHLVMPMYLDNVTWAEAEELSEVSKALVPSGV